MEIHNVEQKKMEVLRELAEATQKVGEAKAEFASVQEHKEVFFSLREQEALKRVENVLNESNELIIQLDSNNNFVSSIVKTVFELIDYLHEAYEDFRKLVTVFQDKQALWEKSVAETEERLKTTKEAQALLKIKLEDKEKALKTLEVKIRTDRRVLNDERATLERSINRLKDGKI